MSFSFAIRHTPSSEEEEVEANTQHWTPPTTASLRSTTSVRRIASTGPSSKCTSTRLGSAVSLFLLLLSWSLFLSLSFFCRCPKNQPPAPRRAGPTKSDATTYGTTHGTHTPPSPGSTDRLPVFLPPRAFLCGGASRGSVAAAAVEGTEVAEEEEAAAAADRRRLSLEFAWTRMMKQYVGMAWSEEWPQTRSDAVVAVVAPVDAPWR